VLSRVIEQSVSPLTALQLHHRAQQEHPRLGVATVYRLIASLLASGELRELHLPGEQATRYELVRRPHGHYFLCDLCNRLYSLPGCVSFRNLLPAGFELTRHEITLYGRCAHCC
jgi:Fur family ferric uptake transcriptional regulator